jgi:rubredoxin---NAD+ reductase
MNPGLVIVGSGLAGYTLAREWRKRDKTAALTVISRDHGGFYSKPMLSNALASGKAPAALVMKDAAAMASELNATVLAQCQVTHIDTAGQQLQLADGRTLPYRDLVLATGADPIRLPLAGEGAAAVRSVNDLEDYALFAGALQPGDTVAVLGAGLIGCEFANDLLALGCKPVVVDLAAAPLGRLLPPEAGEWMRHRLEAAGILFRWGAAAQAVNRAAQGLQVMFDSGPPVEAQHVLSAVGLRPRVALAKAAGLNGNQGIVVNALLASSQEHVYALGDNAELAGRVLPYVMPLMHQARALAATLSGTPTEVVYPAMPVTVKTPACPAVVCPPPTGALGQWEVRTTEQACEALFRTQAGALAGFAVLGAAVSQRQVLTAELAAATAK